MATRVFDAPFGPLILTASELGVSEIWFGRTPRVDVSDNSDAALASLDEAQRQLSEYFDGRRTTFDVPLDRRSRKGFRGEVLDALETVPFGTTVTYGELAANAGRPNAARAVGSTMATNPIAIIVPCHRVLPSGGGVGQFGGGVAAKEWLLRREGCLD